MNKKRILVIEDEKDILKPLVFRLEKQGFSVLSASDGEIGLKEVKENLPDLIILDLFLPKLSGEEICKLIRETGDEEIENIPIVMLTAKSSEADRIVGRVIGANSYLTKPFEIQELMREIERLI